jgi:6-phosphogluconolactonase/glucosamine-6-phosphate isomerase/deaminase
MEKQRTWKNIVCGMNEEVIKGAGSIDLQILGLDRNGH